MKLQHNPIQIILGKHFDTFTDEATNCLHHKLATIPDIREIAVSALFCNDLNEFSFSFIHIQIQI